MQWNDYIFAGGEMVGVYYEKSSGNLTRYFHKDNLDSIAVITDETGTVVERDAYDSWGKRRYPNGTDDTAGTLASLTSRGYTGQEHMPDVGLINYNGRVYDPQLGRFLSADPYVKDALNTQALNRYAYVENNPLAFNDPNGFGFLGDLFGGIAHFISSVFHAVNNFLAHNQWAQVLFIAAAALACGPGAPACAIAASAAASAYITGIKGGSVGDIFKTAVITAATAAAFYGVGSITAGHANAAGLFTVNGRELTGLEYMQTPQFAANVLGHAVVGCASSVAQGGKCGPGAVGAAAGDIASTATISIEDPNQRLAVGTLTSASAGGVASVAAGGKFVNGAETAAFGYLFNDVVLQGTQAASGFHQRLVVEDSDGNIEYGISFGTTGEGNPYIDNLSASGKQPQPGQNGNGEVYEDMRDQSTGDVRRLETTPQEDEEVIDYLKTLNGRTGPYNVFTNSCRTFCGSLFDRIQHEILRSRNSGLPTFY